MEARQLTKELGLAFALMAALFLPSSVALADDPSVYEPDAMGSLFEVPDLRGGLEPTLFEKYPDDAYMTTWKSQGWTHLTDNTVDPVLNGVANSMLSFSRAFTRAAIGLTWFLTDFSATNDLVAQLTPMVGAVANSAMDWLLPSFLVIGGLVVFIKVRIGTGEAINQLLAIMLAGVAAMSLAQYPAVWTESIQGIRQLGMSTTTTATSTVTTNLQIPFAGPTPTFGGDESQNAQRRMGDAIWRTFTVTPWCIAEFGSMRACEDFGETMLALSNDDRADFLDGTEVNGINFPNAVGGKETAAWKFATGQEGTTRMAIALPALISSGTFAGLLIYLDSLSLVYYMLSMLLLVIGVFFLIFMLVPGKLRQWGFSWLDKVFTFTLISVISTLVLTATVTVALAAMTLIGTAGWGIASLVTIIGSFASLLLFRQLREIFGFSATGIGALLGTAAAARHVLKRNPRQGNLNRRTPSVLQRAPRTHNGGRTEYGPNDFQRGMFRGTPPRPSRPSGPAGPALPPSRRHYVGPSTRQTRYLAGPAAPHGLPGTPPPPAPVGPPSRPQLPSSPGTTVLNGSFQSGPITYQPAKIRNANAPRRITPLKPARLVQEPPTPPAPAPAPPPRQNTPVRDPANKPQRTYQPRPNTPKPRTPKDGD